MQLAKLTCAHMCSHVLTCAHMYIAQDTNVQPGRKIVRQLTGVDSSPGAEVSFSAVDQTQSGCLQERGNVVAAELTYLRAAVQSVASVAH